MNTNTVPDSLPELSQRRKHDRERMVATVTELALAHGAACRTHCSDLPGHSREIRVDITAPGGLAVHVVFDGRAFSPNLYLLAWHLESGSTNRLNPAVFPHVNPHHHRKCTECVEGFQSLCERLTRCLAAARTGAAYRAPATACAVPA